MPGTLGEPWNDVLGPPSESGTMFGRPRRKGWNNVWGAWNGVRGACNGVWEALERRLGAWDVGGALERRFGDPAEELKTTFQPTPPFPRPEAPTGNFV